MKPIEDLCKPHPASGGMFYFKSNPDGSVGEGKNFDLEYYYSLAKGASLPESAPENIKELWETAQHLMVYSFYEYTFVVVADLYCAMVVETALKQICKDQIDEYNQARALKNQKSRDPRFEEVLDFFKVKTLEVLTPDEATFLHERLTAMKNLRNSFAHPTIQTLMPVNLCLLVITSEWLGAYYRGQLKELVVDWMENSKDENMRIKKLMESVS